jgi:thiol-disulfide isomerase/thioredoxin
MTENNSFYNKEIELTGDPEQLILDKYTGRPGMFLFYAPWCPHCKNPKITKLIPILHKQCSKKNIPIHTFNCERPENKDISVNGYPTLKFFDKNGQLEEAPNTNPHEIVARIVQLSDGGDFDETLEALNSEFSD